MLCACRPRTASGLDRRARRADRRPAPAGGAPAPARAADAGPRTAKMRGSTAGLAPQQRHQQRVRLVEGTSRERGSRSVPHGAGRHGPRGGQVGQGHVGDDARSSTRGALGSGQIDRGGVQEHALAAAARRQHQHLGRERDDRGREGVDLAHRQLGVRAHDGDRHGRRQGDAELGGAVLQRRGRGLPAGHQVVDEIAHDLRPVDREPFGGRGVSGEQRLRDLVEAGRASRD